MGYTGRRRYPRVNHVLEVLYSLWGLRKTVDWLTDSLLLVSWAQSVTSLSLEASRQKMITLPTTQCQCTAAVHEQ